MLTLYLLHIAKERDVTKKIVNVYPDYCSSGLWDERGVGVDERKLNISKILRIALEHWHYQWETWQIDMGSEKHPAEVWLNISIYRDWETKIYIVTGKQRSIS